jgi:release factor glutamine methyltransferase
LLRGARPLAVLFVLSRVLRAVRRVLHPSRAFIPVSRFEFVSAASCLELQILSASQTIRTILKQAQVEITAALELPVNEARLEAQILLQECLKVNRAWLLAHENDTLVADTHALYQALLNRRLEGEPVAYILGQREFYGLQFKVTPDTLIPRPDTETLVETALQKISPIPIFPRKRGKAEFRGTAERESSNLIKPDSGLHRNDGPRVLDLGTGTGAIAIAIAKHCPHAQVIAVDESPAALEVAEENARNLDIRNVQFVLSNWFGALEGQTFDVIVSNPPYVAENDPHLNQGDLRFEPLSALAAGQDGLDDFRHIISHARQYLAPQGWLMLEHGYDQAVEVAGLLEAAGFGSISSVADLQGVLRVTAGQLP